MQTGESLIPRPGGWSLSPLLKGRGPEADFADLRLWLGLAIFSKSNAHGHFFESLASELFNLFNDVPDVPYNAQFLTIFIYLRLSCHHEPALKALLRNCKTKGSSQTLFSYIPVVPTIKGSSIN